MSGIKMDDRLQDALIDTAVDAYLTEEGRKALEEIEGEPLLPLPGKLQRALRREKKWRSIQHKHRKIAAAAIMFLLVGSLMVSFGTVEAFRLSLSHFFQQVSESISRTVMQSEVAASSNASLRLLEYIPDGFICVKSDTQSGQTRIRYERGKDVIVFSQSQLSNTTIDAFVGDREANDIVNGVPAIITEAAVGNTIVIWYTDQEYFMLTSSLNKREVIKMAESVNLN